MSIQYVQLKEASELTGKNEMTIRRLAKKPESKKYVKREEKKILINAEYLYKHYPPTPKVVDQQAPIQKSIQNEQEPIHVYRQEYIQNLLAAKDETIKFLNSELESRERTLNQVLERNREQNIIMQSLQDKIVKQLPENPHPNTTYPGEGKVQIKRKKRELDKFEMLMAGVAILSGIALLGFIGLMVYAYLYK
jgi:preprotein translocase subunit Sss1